MSAVIRLLRTQPAAVGSAAAAVYAAAAMLYRAYGAHTGVLDTDVAVAAVVAVYGLWLRMQVTPLARPRDRAGRPLTQ